MSQSQIVTVATVADLEALDVSSGSFLSNKVIGIVGADSSFGAMGQAQIVVVLDVAALGVLPLTPSGTFLSGKTLAIVSSTGRMYYLADSVTPDGTSVVGASDGRDWVAVGVRYYLTANTGQTANGTSLLDASDGRQWVQF